MERYIETIIQSGEPFDVSFGERIVLRAIEDSETGTRSYKVDVDGNNWFVTDKGKYIPNRRGKMEYIDQYA